MKVARTGLALLLLAAAARGQTAPPRSVVALLRQARTQMEQKNAAGALESLRRARAIAPNSEEVLSAYAGAAIAAHAPLSAVPVLEALVRMAPTEARYQHLRGVTLLRLGDSEAAVASLREAARLEPDRAAYLVALGTALNRGGLYAEAKAELDRATSLDPEAADAWAAMAEAEAGLGERDAAESLAQRALARSGADPTANLVLGSVRLEQSRYAEARDALLKADPDSPDVQARLGQAYARLNDPVSAQKHEELSRRKKKEGEERVKEVRRLTGFAPGEPRS